MTEWILKKRGLFYRPNDCGYTGIRDHAGRYTEDEARARAVNGVTMMRLADAPEFSEMCYDDLARKHLTEQRDAARAALKPFADIAGLVKITPRRDGERVFELPTPEGGYFTLTRDDFRRAAAALYIHKRPE